MRILILITMLFIGCSKTTFVESRPPIKQVIPSGVSIEYYVITTESGWFVSTTNIPRETYYIDGQVIQSWCKNHYSSAMYFRATEGEEAYAGSTLEIRKGGRTIYKSKLKAE